ncbi:MAG: hypothetical protein CM15mP69_5940 [Ectothiorhodospiraceae bacterium]|nr:MAG: hypothetical protein CM15mP69_5940 [Ectothiorhodospiraceae bacterium]
MAILQTRKSLSDIQIKNKFDYLNLKFYRLKIS